MKTEDYSIFRNRCLKPNMAQKPLYARLFLSHISVAIVKLLVNTPVTPNQVTFFALITGLLSCIFFAFGTLAMYIWGALALELFYLLDMVDGQLSRYRQTSTLTGAFFDHIATYIVHPWIFVCLGIGLYRHSHSIVIVIAGTAAGLGILMNYLIHDARSNIILGYFKRKRPPTSQTIEEKAVNKTSSNGSFVKSIYSLIHKWSTYPYIMHVISILAFIVGPLIALKGAADVGMLFMYMLYAYALILNVKLIATLYQWIRTRKIDKDYNPGSLLEIWS